MMMPVSKSPRNAITIAAILDDFFAGRRSPYPTVVAVTND